MEPQDSFRQPDMGDSLRPPDTGMGMRPPDMGDGLIPSDMAMEGPEVHGTENFPHPPVPLLILCAEITAAVALIIYGIYLIVMKLMSETCASPPCDRYKYDKAFYPKKEGAISVLDQSLPSCDLKVKCRPPKRVLKYKPRCFTISEVMQITDTLRVKLGNGGSGAVYYGCLSNGQEIAIKRLSASMQTVAQFQTEVELMSRVRHENIVAMLGHCCELDERMLIYEFMPRGALHDYLYGPQAFIEPLSWQQRLQIALDTAKGLEHLHERCKPPIIHRDVKSSNILLDEDFRAKVSDFGMSKLMVQGNAISNGGIKGTIGYIDPEYFASQRVDITNDVYSFGIVLLELICGRQAIVPTVKDPSIVENIVDWVLPLLRSNNLEAIIDKTLTKDFSMFTLDQVLKLALLCVDRDSLHRPLMQSIVIILQDALAMDTKVGNIQCTSVKERTKLSFFLPTKFFT